MYAPVMPAVMGARACADPAAAKPRLTHLNVRTPFADPAQVPDSMPPSPTTAVSPRASHDGSTASRHELSATGSASYGTPVATPSVGQSWMSANSAFVTPNSLASAVSGASFMSAADTLPGHSLHHSAAANPEASSAVVPSAVLPHTPRLGPPPGSPPAWQGPREAEPAVVIEVDDFSVHSAAGGPGASVAVHIQDVAAWEAGAVRDGEEHSGGGPARGPTGVFSRPRGPHILHSAAAAAATTAGGAWPPSSARGPGSVAMHPRSGPGVLPLTPSIVGSDRGHSAALPGQPATPSPFRLPQIRSRPGSGTLPRNDSLPRSARRSSQLSRCSSLSLLHVQSRPSPFTSPAPFDAPQYGPPPLVSITSRVAPMRTDVDVTPLTVTVTPRLIQFAVSCGKPFEKLLPAAPPATALQLPAASALVAAADAAVDAALPAQTLSLRMHGVAVRVLLPSPGETTDSQSEVVANVSVDEVRCELGSISDPHRISRLLEDLRTAHAFEEEREAPSGGQRRRAALPLGVDSAAAGGLAGELWQHAGAASAVRLPAAALAAALTVPMHARVAEVALGMHERWSGSGYEEAGDWDMPDGMHDAADAAPLLTIAAADATVCMPSAQFAPADADGEVVTARATITHDDVRRGQRAMEASEKLAADIELCSGGQASAARSVPWLQVHGALQDVWVRVAGTCMEQACLDATLATASCSYSTPPPDTYSGGGVNTAVPSDAWAACSVNVSDFSVAQVGGKLDSVLPAIALFVPGGIRMATLRAVRVHAAVDPMSGAPQQLAGEACGLQVMADPPVATQSGFWDSAAGTSVSVIGATGEGFARPSGHDDGSAHRPWPGVVAQESLLRVAFVAADGADVPAVINVLVRNACVSTLFISEIITLVQSNSAPSDGGEQSGSPPDDHGTEPSEQSHTASPCICVEIVGCELAAPAPPGRPARGGEGPAGGAALRIGRTRVVLHGGWLQDKQAAAVASLTVMQRSVRQADWLKSVASEQLRQGMQIGLGGACCAACCVLCAGRRPSGLN